MQQQIAWHLEQRVAREKHARAEGERRVGKTRIVLQRLLCEADIRAIEKREHVHEQQERQQPAHRLAHDAIHGRH
jgi:hypothetical protein